MEFGFTEEQEKLRKETHDFYANELPEDVSEDVTPLNEELQSFWMQLQKKAGAKGYLAPAWPKETGGLGLGALEQGIVNEQEGHWGITWPDSLGLNVCGPGIHLFGTEEQKKNFLPEITSGEKIWYECFTEPNAGTDEANQQTRAVKDGDDYIINGQKIYMTGRYKADYCYVECRTADTIPKHRGLSLFAIPADTPGISFRPLPCMGGWAANEVFFDNVRVSKDCMVGEENRGFYHVMQTFEFERSNTASPARAKRNLQEFVQFCKEEKRNGKPLIEDPEVRRKLAQMAIDVEVYRLVAWRTAWRFSEREKLGPLDFDLTGYFTKVFNTRHYKWVADILGSFSQLRMGSKWAKLAGKVERRWQSARSFHPAGTWEAMKIVLAGRVLGLPRIPAKLNTVITQALQERT